MIYDLRNAKNDLVGYAIVQPMTHGMTAVILCDYSKCANNSAEIFNILAPLAMEVEAIRNLDSKWTSWYSSFWLNELHFYMKPCSLKDYLRDTSRNISRYDGVPVLKNGKWAPDMEGGLTNPPERHFLMMILEAYALQLKLPVMQLSDVVDGRMVA